MKSIFTCPNILLLVITGSFCDTSYEDIEYGNYFEKYDEHDEWRQESSEMFEWGPVNVRGRLRKRFAYDASLIDTEKSLVCSPFAALLPLGKLALGADGDCLKQILQVIGVDSRSELARAFKPILKKMQKIVGVTLAIVSTVYITDDIIVASKIKNRVHKIFDSTVSSVDFKTPGKAVGIINNFVSSHTGNLITNVVTDIDIPQDSSVVLINAVYFTGIWAERFSQVHLDQFITPTVTKMVPMMSRLGTFKHTTSKDLEVQIVEIPFLGDEAVFTLLLPKSKDDLPRLLQKIRLSPELMQQALMSMMPKELILTMPKFRIETQLDLMNSYQWLGLLDMFEVKKSGLEGISNENLKENQTIYVSKGIQKAIIDINERGGDTGYSYSSNIFGGDPEKDMAKQSLLVNIPFMFFIKFKHEQIFFGTCVFNK